MKKYIAKKPDADGIVHYSQEEHETWKILIDRQLDVVQNRGCPEYLAGLQKLSFARDRIPQCGEVTQVLKACTGWSVVPVAAIIPLQTFFQLLSERKFPAATFIRKREELDYLQEPDIFHELFGHCPLLTNSAYADFVQWYGEMALRVDPAMRTLLGRLFWFTIEFGLVNTKEGLRIFGGGILSSFEETKFALESSQPERLQFNIKTVLSTDYRYDQIQKRYFILDNFNSLFQLKGENILNSIREVIQPGEHNEDFHTC